MFMPFMDEDEPPGAHVSTRPAGAYRSMIRRLRAVTVDR
jgi:hypothetical protein